MVRRQRKPSDGQDHASSGAAETGRLRVVTDIAHLADKVRTGDIVVLDAYDLPDQLGRALAEAQPLAVVTTGPFVSGRLPTTALRNLHAAGVRLLAGAGTDILACRSGAKASVARVNSAEAGARSGTVRVGEQEFSATWLDTAAIEELSESSQAALPLQLATFLGNAVNVLEARSAEILSGVGLPAVDLPLADRKLLIIDASIAVQELRKLRTFVREAKPALWVDAVAAELAQRTFRRNLDVIVGDVDVVPDRVLKKTGLLLHPDPLSPAGQTRVENFQVGHQQIDSFWNAVELGLAVGTHGRASLIVVAAPTANLSAHLGAQELGTMWYRLINSQVVSSRAVAGLFRHRIPTWAVAIALLVALIAVAGAVLLHPDLREFVDNWINGRG